MATQAKQILDIFAEERRNRMLPRLSQRSTEWQAWKAAAARIEPLCNGHEEATSVERMSRDLREAAATLTVHEARFLTDAYYAMQEDRIRAGHQIRTLAQANTDPEKPVEPHAVMTWLMDQSETLENQIRNALDHYSANHPVGRWARSIVGIGPVIAAGLLSHIDITRAPTVGHIWRFAGLDPTQQWLGRDEAGDVVREVLEARGETRGAVSEGAVEEIAARINVKPERLIALLTDFKTGKVSYARKDVISAVAKRPWNGRLKTLCWKIGESFVKFSSHPGDIYGKVYAWRKECETVNNEAGKYADQARQSLEEFNFSEGTDARKHYEAGRLPPARIQLRAQRYAVKLFLSHLHHVWYEIEYGRKPPLPYVIEHGGHVHFIAPPNWPMG